MPSYNVDMHPYFLKETVTVVALFIDVFDDKYCSLNCWSKKVLIRMLANFDFSPKFKGENLYSFRV